jgi:hypothetical protein
MDLLSELKRLDETMSPAPLLATVDPKREYAWIREADGTFLHSPLGMNPDDAEGFVALRNLLPALIASVPSARERRLEEALREIANAPRLTSLHEYSGELCDAKWTADVAVAALENQTAKP